MATKVRICGANDAAADRAHGIRAAPATMARRSKAARSDENVQNAEGKWRKARHRRRAFHHSPPAPARVWSRPISRVLYPLRDDSHSSRPDVAVRLERPTRERRGPRHGPPIRSCSRWGLPCPAALAPQAVRSYRTVSPLPRLPLPAAFGGLLSVALAVGSRRPGVTWHLALWSPDFPRRIAATRLSGRLRCGVYWIEDPEGSAQRRAIAVGSCPRIPIHSDRAPCAPLR